MPLKKSDKHTKKRERETNDVGGALILWACHKKLKQMVLTILINGALKLWNKTINVVVHLLTSKVRRLDDKKSTSGQSRNLLRAYDRKFLPNSVSSRLRSIFIFKLSVLSHLDVKWDILMGEKTPSQRTPTFLRRAWTPESLVICCLLSWRVSLMRALNSVIVAMLVARWSISSSIFLKSFFIWNYEY